jgi:hypothetical protein
LTPTCCHEDIKLASSDITTVGENLKKYHGNLLVTFAAL